MITDIHKLTTHKQSLSILCIDEEEEKNKESQTKRVKRVTGILAIEGSESKRSDALESSDFPPTKVIKLAPSAQPLPETNGLYKCLDLGLSSSGLHSWLFSLPKRLKLKMLSIQAHDLTRVPEDIMIQVEHVAFSPPARTGDTPTNYIPAISLEKFVISNSVVKRLEFTTSVWRGEVYSVHWRSKGLLPALNHCLSVLYQQGRGLEEIILNSVEFSNDNNTKEFFIRVRDLSHSHGTTLVMNNLQMRRFIDVASTQEDKSSLFVDLFQENKIKKIIFTADEYKEIYKSLLKPLTEELVLYCT